MLNRRKFLTYGFFGAGLLTLSGIGLGLQSTKQQQPQQELLILSPVEFSILHAIADRLFPANPPFPAASALHVAEQVDLILATSDPYVQEEIKQVLHLFENALFTTLFDAHFRPFSQSSPQKQDQLLQSWQQSSLHVRRTAFKALNGLCGAAYYSNESVHKIVGYNGPPDYLIALVKAAGKR